MPDTDFNTLEEKLKMRVNELSHRNLDEFFTGMLQKRIGQVLLKNIGCKLSDKTETLDSTKIKKLANLMKNWKFSVVGTTGFLNSQVTAGGLSTDEFFNTTMECKTAKGLYCIGEILDIDGDCGGFNLQWAWSSAFCAADSVKENLYGTDKLFKTAS